MGLGESERERKECSQGSQGKHHCVRSGMAACFTAPVETVKKKKARTFKFKCCARSREREGGNANYGTVPTSIKCSEGRAGLTKNSFSLCQDSEGKFRPATIKCARAWVRFILIGIETIGTGPLLFKQGLF